MKALIAITTCKRLSNIKAHALNYIDFCNRDPDFDFVIALDGNDEDYLVFCEQWDIPLLYSEDREGVGISKNRVYREFAHYDYYFFLEDDAELLDPAVFRGHIEVSEKSGIPHFSLFEPHGSREIIEYSQVGEYRLIHSKYGSAQFNFFTGKGLSAVGGWHDAFAKPKRYGHTEHTYRFVHAGLSKYAFNVIENFSLHCDYFIWHDPPSVSAHNSNELDVHGIAAVERKVMDLELAHYEVMTPGPYRYNGKKRDRNEKIAHFLQENREKKYPWLEGKQRREQYSNFCFNKIRQPISGVKKLYYFGLMLWYNYNNFRFKHLVKQKLGLVKS